MKQNILICSIFRNREAFVDRWFQQIKLFTEKLSNEYTFSISIYENDSLDRTVEKIKSLNFDFLDKVSFLSEKKNTIFYGSIKNSDRVKNLALARNMCLDSEKINLADFNKVLFIEPDFKYNTEDAIKIITADKIHNKNIDIISGVSLFMGNFYDSWATRKTDLDTENRINVGLCLESFWSTFNGFCCYNCEPFKKGVRFHWFNKRLNTYDCDTAVICENFREIGYNEIYIDTSAVFHHEN